MRDILKPVLVPIHKEGRSFVALFALVTFVLGLLWEPFWFIGTPLTLWCVYFFRDPDRITPTRPGLVISPADGVVCQVRKAAPPAELGIGDETWTRVAIFMNVFNVHVNRVPIDGTITKLHYRRGKMVNAAMDKASEDNERQSFAMETKDGKDIAFVQIAGLVARRILCDISPGDDVRAGQRFGLIRFGSRVDVYLPPNVMPFVTVGQTMIAGETVLADLGGHEEEVMGREGEVR